MAYHNGKDQTRHSFLNALDDIATTPTELTFTTLPGSELQHAELYGRPSTSRKCSSQQPELPIPVYDNGNVTISRPAKPTVHIPYFKPLNEIVDANATRQQAHTFPDRQPELWHEDQNDTCGTALSSPPVRHVKNDESNQFLLPAAGFDLRHKRSLPATQLASDLSKMNSQATDIERRPRTSGSTRKSKVQYKKTITYEDQRCDPPRILESYKALRSLPKPQLPRHPLKLITSLKELHTKADSSRETSEDLLSVPNQHDGTSTQSRDSMITIKEALVSVEPLAPLHRPDEDHELTQGVAHSLKSDFEKFSKTNGHCPKQATFINAFQEPPTLPPFLTSAHERRVSEAGSGVTSILDWDWPQPTSEVKAASNKAIKHDQPRPDSDVVHAGDTGQQLPTVQALSMLNDMVVANNSVPSRKRLSRISLSPPPDKPLPSLPQCQTRTTNLAQPRMQNEKVKPAEFRSASLPGFAPTPSLETTTIDRKLYIDCNDPLHRNINSTPTDTLPAVFPSPLRLRLKNNNRNGRVDSLRRRHLTNLARDTDSIKSCDGSSIFEEDLPRRGSAPSTLQTTSTYKITKPTYMKEGAFFNNNDEYRSVTNRKKNHRRQNSSVSSITKSKSNSPRRKLSSNNSVLCVHEGQNDKAANHQASGPTLARSYVKIMVDTDPKNAFGFHAGAISPTPSQSARSCSTSHGQSSDHGRYSQTSVYSRPSTAGSYSSATTGNGTDDTDITAASFSIDSNPFEDAKHTKTLLPSLLEDNQKHLQVPATNQGRLEVQHLANHNLQHETISKDPQSQIDRLNSELDRMTRVYRCMIHSRTGLRPEGIKTKTYAELLEDDRRANTVARRRSQRGSPEVSPTEIMAASFRSEEGLSKPLNRSKYQESSYSRNQRSTFQSSVTTGSKCEASECPKGMSMKERSASLPNVSSAARRGSQHRGKIAASIPAKFSLYPSTQKHPLAATLPLIPPRYAVVTPQKTASRAGSFSDASYKKPTKRQSIVSLNSTSSVFKVYKTPRTSPVSKSSYPLFRTEPLSVEEASSMPSVRRLVAQAHDHPAEDINLDVDPSLDLNHCLTSTSQMEQAIDNFVLANDTQPLSPLEGGFETQSTTSC